MTNMTNKVAIRLLEQAIPYIHDMGLVEAHRRAISALKEENENETFRRGYIEGFSDGVARGLSEQQPCEDAISREAVLDGLKGCICDEWVKTLFATMVKQLPSVTQCDIDAIRREIEDLYIITNPASDPYDGGYYTALIDVKRIIDKYTKGDKE